MHFLPTLIFCQRTVLHNNIFYFETFYQTHEFTTLITIVLLIFNSLNCRLTLGLFLPIKHVCFTVVRWWILWWDMTMKDLVKLVFEELEPACGIIYGMSWGLSWWISRDSVFGVFCSLLAERFGMIFCTHRRLRLLYLVIPMLWVFAYFIFHKDLFRELFWVWILMIVLF